MFSALLFLTLCFITIQDCKSASFKDDGSSWDFPWLVPYRPGAGPEILNILTNRTLSPGKGVSFRCRVVGNPRPRIKWKKDGTAIVQSLRVKIRQFDWGSRLRIKNIQPADEGVYKCIAKSHRGQKVSASAYVKVKGNRRNKHRRCQMYTGRFCSARLVYVPGGKQQYHIDRRLAKIIKQLKTSRCQKQLIVFHCHLNYPTCPLRNNEKPRMVCREDCHKLEKKFCRRDVRILGSLWYQSVVCSKLPWTNCQRIFDRVPSHRQAANKTAGQGKKNNYHSRKTCKSYQGDVCKPYMTAGGLVTTHGQQTQAELERGLRRVLLLLQNYTSTSCKQYLHTALCYHLFPPCSTGPRPTPRQMCRLQCEVLQGRICSKEFRLARLSSPDSNLIPWCSELPGSLGNNGDSCLSLGINVNENDDSGWDKCSGFLKRNQKKKFPFTVMSRWLGKNSWCTKETPLSSAFKIPRNVNKLFPRSNFSSARISFSKKQHQTSYCFESPVRLKKLVLSWNHYHRTSPLPHLRIPLTSIQVPGVQVILDNVSSKLRSILVPLGSAVSYRVHEKVLLENVTFYYRYQSTRGSFIANGHYRLCGTVFKVSMETLENGVVKISGNSRTPLDVNTIERVFGLASPMTKLIEDAIRKSELLIMRIMSPSIQIYIDKDITVRFAGQSFWTSDGHSTFLEFYGGKRRQADVLVASLTSEGLTFDKVVRTMTGFEISSLDWSKGTSSRSHVGILLSTLDLNSSADKKFRIMGQPLSRVLAGSIPAGLTFMFQTRVPGNCSGVRMCEMVKAAFGQDSLFTMIATSKQDRVLIDVTFQNISHDALVAYKSIQLSLKIVNGNFSYLDILPSITFDISGYIRLVDRYGKQENKLHFTGMFEYSGIWAKLMGQFDVNQYWNHAFNIPYLAFKNMRASFTVPTDGFNTPPDHSLSTRGDFEFGIGCSTANTTSINKDGCITGQVFLGLSQDIREHYFYGSVGSVSLQQLLKACGMNVNLPTAVANTGFPSGLKISIARTIHDVGLEGGPLIRPGLLMSGTINMLGIESDASISLLPSEFSVDAELDGASMELLDEASPAENVLQHGKEYRPVVYIKTRLNPDAFVKVHVDAYSRIFGVFDEVRVLISRQVTQIKMVAEIHKSIQAHVYLMCNNSKRVNTTHLKAKIIFKNQLSKLTRLASKHVITMLEAEMSQLKVAEKELKRKSKQCAKAAKSACLRCSRNSNCLSKLSHCTPQQISILLSECQRMVLDGCKKTNDTCQGVCAELASYSNDSCLAYHNAATTLRKLQYSLQWVRQTRLLMAGSLFNIHSISFQAQVSASDIMNTVVDTTFDVTIFGQRNRLTGLKVHLDSFSKLAAEIAKQAVTWYDKRHRLHSN